MTSWHEWWTSFTSFVERDLPGIIAVLIVAVGILLVMLIGGAVRNRRAIRTLRDELKGLRGTLSALQNAEERRLMADTRRLSGLA